MADTCPKCGFTGVAGDKCGQCGVIVPLYEAFLEKMRRGPQGRAPAPAASPPARAAAAPAAPASTAATTAPVTPPRWAASSAPRAATGAPVAATRRLSFHGAGVSLFGIQIVNAFLTLLTLGVYYFWGKTRVRAYLLSQTQFETDRFAYHGTGHELLLGSMKAGLVFGIPMSLLNVLPDVLDASMPVRVGSMILLYAIAMLFIPVAMVGARRYRLSRTSWRGIRFSFRGPVRDFVKIFGRGSLLSLLTLGIYYPFFLVQRQAFMVSHSYFGSHRFGFDGRGRDLLRPAVVTALLFPFTLGLSWFWWAARKQRYFTDHTSFEGSRFRCTVTGRALFWLMASNVALLLVTLGLAWPWLVVRTVRFHFRNVTLEGPLDLTAVRQEAQTVSTTGEGLAGLLDADFGVS